MSIYKRGKVYYYHFYFNERHIQESTHQGNPRIARQMEAAHRTALAKGEVGLRDKQRVPALQEFCTRVEAWARASFESTSRKTFLWYSNGLRAICAYNAIANRKLDEITSEHCADFAAHLKSEGRLHKAKDKSTKLETSSVNAVLRVLRRALRLGVEWGVTSAAPKVKMLRGEHHRDRVLTQEEEARYLTCAPEPLASIATVLVDTGFRPEEAFRLRWENVYFERGRHGALFNPFGKTQAARRLVPMSVRVRTLLLARRENAGNPDSGFVWPAHTASGHVEPFTIKKQHRNALRQSGIRPFVLYSLRHTFLTRLGEAGCDPWTLARLAGHSSIAMSARYVHPNEEAALDAIARLQSERTIADAGPESADDSGKSGNGSVRQLPC